MAALKKVFGNWWVLSALAAVFAGLLFVVLLPLVAAPLRPLWVRLVFLLVIAAIWGGLAAWRVLSARAASAKLAEGLAAEAAAPGEDAEVAKRMQAAMAGLKSVSGSRREYLYSRPWYVIIGPPGAGKTTALVNSGLRFPFSDTALKGAGGTRNLDFWFADEAVLVDTAGRYTTQDSDAERDKGAWSAFLQLLRRNRPLQPVNGVLVAIGLDELIGADVAKIDRHAATVRRRLAEIQSELEVSTPVYVIFTKVDLLAGFGEYYDDLDVEGRRAVVGATLPVSADPRPSQTEIVTAFDEMAQAAADRSAKRLQEELDARRRSLILGFPAQLTGLRSRVVRFLDGAFPANAPEAPAPLRGFYFTSGVQQGTPVDRLLSGMAQVYDAPAQPQGVGQGRAYFLNRLLTEVVIPEAGLVASSAKSRARRTAQVVGGLAAVGVVSLLVLIAWAVSFAANRGFQSKLLAGAQNASQEVRSNGVDLTEVRESDPDLESSLSLLRSLRDLPRGYGEQQKGGPPLSMRAGLYQSTDATTASRAYLDTLQRVMLPRILLRLERYLNDHRAEPLALYEPLKVYLMLGAQAPQLDSKAVKSWVQADWARNVYPGEDRADLRKELNGHLDALLRDPQFGSVWPERRAPLDGALITATRAQVQTLSLSDRAYAVLRQHAAASDGPEWRASAALSSGDAKAFANGAQVLGATIPYFYTKAGFEKAYKGGLADVQADLERDLWVLGGDQNTASIRAQMSSVRPGVAALYARDYIKAWQDLVASLQPADVFTDQAAFGAATGSPPPLKTLLQQVAANTSLSGAPSAQEKAEGQAEKAALAKAGPLGKLAPAAGPPVGQDAARIISDAFAPIRQFAGSGAGPAPVDEFIAKLKAAVTAKGAADRSASLGGGAGDASQAELAKAMSELAAASATAPAMIQNVTAAASKAGDKAQVSAATGAVSTVYEQQLAPQCRSVTEQRYPFVTASKNDAPLGDLLRVFGMNAGVDQFTQTKLRPLLDTSGPVWRWKAGDPVAAALDPTSADEFRKAEGVRDLLVSGAPLKVESAGFGGAVTAAEIAFGGQTQRFDANQAGQRTMQWTASSLPEAHVTLYAGAVKLKEITADGPWALFRLMDGARKENAGPQTIKATFGDGATTATFRFTLPSPENPFSRGGPWSFRCPPKL